MGGRAYLAHALGSSQPILPLPPLDFMFLLFLSTLPSGILIYIHLTSFSHHGKTAKGKASREGIIMRKKKHFKTKAKLTVTATAATISNFFQVYILLHPAGFQGHIFPPTSVNSHVIVFYQSYKFQRKKGLNPLVLKNQCH